MKTTFLGNKSEEQHQSWCNLSLRSLGTRWPHYILCFIIWLFIYWMQLSIRKVKTQTFYHWSLTVTENVFCNVVTFNSILTPSGPLVYNYDQPPQSCKLPITPIQKLDIWSLNSKYNVLLYVTIVTHHLRNVTKARFQTFSYKYAQITSMGISLFTV